MARVAVIGAGIVGLSTAVCIQEEIPNVQVTIFADLQKIHTTSDGAAGVFHPDNVQVDSREDLKQWIKDSADRYWWECYNKSMESGIFELSGYSVTNHDMALVEDPIFHDHVRNYRRLQGNELDKVGGGPWRYGSFKTTMLTEPRILMEYRFKQFLQNGGNLVERRLESLSELVTENWDVVVNCTGLGARNLVSDNTMYPIRGQVLRVRAPWIKHFYFAEDCTYILPNSELVVLGGTRQKNDWNVNLCKEDRDGFMARCARLVPSVMQAEPVREWVGLRPGRPTVRLETENMQFAGDKVLPVIHNYGHGGNGIALSWGCGKHAARLTQQTIQENSSR